MFHGNISASLFVTAQFLFGFRQLNIKIFSDSDSEVYADDLSQISSDFNIYEFDM